METRQDTIRPAQWAALLLASGDSLPRQRARDQQADHAGGQLKRRLLQRITELDPDPDELVGRLDRLIVEFGEPTGPTRAIARILAEEWTSALRDPGLTRWLLDQAVERNRNHP